MARFALDEDFPDTITNLTLAIVEQSGHDPIRAAGLLLVHLPTICRKSVRSVGQIWRLSAQNKNHDDPWKELKRIAVHRKMSVNTLFHEHKLSRKDLERNPLEERPSYDSPPS